MEQRESQNFQKEVKWGRVFYIHGPMRNGKSLLACCIASNDYTRIYSNMQIYKKGSSILKMYITSFQDFKKIRFAWDVGVIVIDEWGINANGKDWLRKTSRILEELLFLSGKVNCDIIFIAQRYSSGNINFRWAASESWLILKCKKISRKKGYPIFRVERQKQKLWSDQLNFHSEFETHPLEFMNSNQLTYDTLERSTLRDSSKDEEGEE